MACIGLDQYAIAPVGRGVKLRRLGQYLFQWGGGTQDQHLVEARGGQIVGGESDPLPKKMLARFSVAQPGRLARHQGPMKDVTEMVLQGRNPLCCILVKPVYCKYATTSLMSLLSSSDTLVMFSA